MGYLMYKGEKKMGLLDSLMGSLKGGSKREGKSQIADMLMQMVGSPEIGGMQGLVKMFQDGGLGSEVMSWIGKGKNMPVSVDQIMQIFSKGKLTEIASKLGISEKKAAAGIKDLLPNIIDKLTPEGDVPDDDMLSKGIDMLKGSLFR